MRFSPKALAITTAIIWGAVLLLTGIASMLFEYYAEDFLLVISSLYPGYQASGSFGDVLVGTAYGIVDGGIAGFIFGWVYNWIADRVESSSP